MTRDQLPCLLCGDDEEVEIVCTIPGAPQRGTIISSCPECLIRKQNKLNTKHAKAVAKLIAEVARLREANQELSDLFDLQQTRMLTATKKWQEATGKHDIFPDLGRLLDWLLDEMETNDG